MPNFSIAFSPCPNDTYIFDALINGHIDTQDINYTASLADVETLNRAAFNEEYDITKLSFHAWLYLQDKYELLNSGAALGNNCGPLLIAKKNYSVDEILLQNKPIAIPGKYTTANFLLQSFINKPLTTKEFVFSEIENVVLNDEVIAGVIIHENRFTFESRGLIKIQDLGEWWETSTHCAIPLGGIAIKKSLLPYKNSIEQQIQESILWSKNRRPQLSDYVKLNAQEMEPNIMQQHIDLYVNDYTLQLGTQGSKAIENMKEKFNTFKLNHS